MRNVFQMRDPLTRFHSRYRFNREILPKLQNRKMIREARTRSKNINDCVEQNHTECDYRGTLPRQTKILVKCVKKKEFKQCYNRWHKQFEMDSQIPFLCGDSEVCRTMGHPEAVNTTIRNIEANYLMVGVLEMLEETVVVMECLMADMMNGLVETFHHTNVHKKSSHAAMPAAVMTSSTRQLMRNRLGPQIILYNPSMPSFFKKKIYLTYM